MNTFEFWCLKRQKWGMDEWAQNQWVKNIFWRLLLCFENSTCVFGRPAVFYELRIQPFLLFLNVKNCCSCNWSHFENNILTNIFSLLSFPLVNHALRSYFYSTEKLIECKWDNTNSCCVVDPNHLQNLLLAPKKWDHSHLISCFCLQDESLFLGNFRANLT